MSDGTQERVDDTVDVLICGGGLAGLTLARQLRREQPQLSVTVVEKSSRPLSDGCHKVGESSVELGSNYFERLGLRSYLQERHIIKYGLRFFPGGGALPLEQRLEIGPAQEPVVPSYQIDRGRFETDVRQMIVDDGATLIEGATVRRVTLSSDGSPHIAVIRDPSGDRELRARWLIDATGRNALLRRELKLNRGTGHNACAGWFRIADRLDINELVPADAPRWHDEPFSENRWRSTNHFMGAGYWVWVIPLSSGMTSIGVVVHDEVHSFDRVRTLERARAFIEEHEPVLARHLTDRPALDFLCLNGYSHGVGRAWSADRWGMVGEAGAFVDPLYSPGSDFIAFANTFTGELIRTDLEGGDLETRAREFNLQYRALVSGNVDIFRIAAPVYGHPRAMLAKVYWDNFAYWSYPCQYYFQGLYRLTGAAHSAFTESGQRFVQLSNYVQSLLREWALLAPESPQPSFAPMPGFPSVLVDAHLALQVKMTPDEALEYMASRAAEGEEIVAEFIVRVVSELGRERASELIDATGLLRWQVAIPQGRIEASETVGLNRRRSLSRLARDVERTLGRAESTTPLSEVIELLRPLISPGSPTASAVTS